ncbi:MAG: class I SAM-dependent methyltransferase [Ruthenibacterium sp.]
MVELRRTQYAHFIEQCHLQGKKIVEVGCGRGEFLKVLTEFPVQAFGIEHKNDLVKIAQENGLHVTQGFAETAETPIDGAPFDAFLSFNFLEHQADPNAMLRCIYNNLATEAYGLITVPSFQYILENDGFYELLRDHIANYTEQTFRFVLEKNGFSVLECTTVNRDTLSAIVQKKKRVDTTNLYDNFSALSAQLQAFLSQRKEQGKKSSSVGRQSSRIYITFNNRRRCGYCVYH